MTTKKKYITTFKTLLFAYLALSKIFYWITNIMAIGPGGFDNLGQLIINRLLARDLFLIVAVIISFYLNKWAKNVWVFYGIFYILILGISFGQMWLIDRFIIEGYDSIFGGITPMQYFVQFTLTFILIGIAMSVKEYMAHVKKKTEAKNAEEPYDFADAPPGTRRKLAHVAKTEAQRFLHGKVMCTEHNLHEVIESFPKFLIEEADGMWCAAFVYYCCKKAGYNIPIKPWACSCNLAGCNAWDEWAQADENIVYATPDDVNFTPAAGDIVLFDRVFEGKEHDHIGVVIENRDASIVTAEGNINNVSGVIERYKDAHIRAYIRLPDHYEYTQN